MPEKERTYQSNTKNGQEESHHDRHQLDAAGVLGLDGLDALDGGRRRVAVGAG